MPGIDGEDGLNFHDNADEKSSSLCQCLDCQRNRDLDIEMEAVKEALGAKLPAVQEELELSILSLKAQQAKTRTKMNQNHDLLTHKLPPEVISSIFKHCLFEAWTCTGHDFSSFKMEPTQEDDLSLEHPDMLGPLFLGQICRAWRDIAWATHSLWATIRIKYDSLTSWSAGRRVELVLEWLERAGSLPLSIHIMDLRSSTSQKDELITSRIISAINERSKQWENLNILGPFRLTSQIVGSLAQGAPSLRALRINHLDEFTDIDNQIPSLFSLSHSKPRPTRLLLSGCQISRIHIQWTSLTHVLAAGLRFGDCIQILQLAPQLKFYTIYRLILEGTMNLTPFSNNRITHKKLESFEVEYLPDCSWLLESGKIMGIFDLFTFPNLTCLKVRGRYSSWAPLVAHVVRSSPPLTTLWIQDRSRNFLIMQNLLPILQITPLLHDLRLTFRLISNEDRREAEDFLRLLIDTSAPDEANGLLPNLRLIGIIPIIHQNNFVGEFWTLILRIFGPISGIHSPRRRPLNTVRFRGGFYGSGDINVPNDPSFVSQFLALKREGITLDFDDQFILPEELV